MIGKGIAGTSLALLLFTVASRIMGMLREVLLASEIGMNAYTDAFNISQSGITLMTAIIGATCLSLVPLLLRSEKQSPERRDQVFTSLFCIYMLVSLVVAIALTLFSENICSFLGPSLSDDAQVLAGNLLRIGFFKINFVMASTMLSYYLQSRSIFIASSLSLFLGNCTVVALLLLMPSPSIYDYTFFTVVGLGVQPLVLLVPVLRVGYRPRIRKLFEVKAMRYLLIASMPFMASMLFFEIQTMAGRAVATSLGDGVTSSLDYAYKLVQMMCACVTMSLNTILFTKFSALAVKGELRETSRLLMLGGRVQFLLIAPAVLIMCFFGEPLIALVFQRGEFTAYDTHVVNLALRGYLLCIWPYVFCDLFTRFFVSIEKYKVVNITCAISYIISLSLIYPLSRCLGVFGISFSFTIAQIIMLVSYIVYIGKDNNGKYIKKIISSLASWRDAIPLCILFVLLECFLMVIPESNHLPALGASCLAYIFYIAAMKLCGVRIALSDID